MIYFSIFNIYHSIFFRIFRVANTSGEIKKWGSSNHMLVHELHDIFQGCNPNL